MLSAWKLISQKGMVMPNTVMLSKKQTDLVFADGENPSSLLPLSTPFYSTRYGAAFLCDSRQTLEQLPSNSVNLIFTSPPYALHFKKEYGNVTKGAYVDWFLEFAREFYRVLKDDGSFVLNIGGSYNEGSPTRSIYHFKLAMALVEEVGFHLAQECFWYDPFAGSNTTGAVSEKLGRRWLASENVEEYLEASKFRFE
jgi:site-specific DNA-methyltransferase (cytosine-N4-specific)